MEQKQITATYAEAVKAIKEAILESRYRAARLATTTIRKLRRCPIISARLFLIVALDRINGFLVRIEDAYCTKERMCNWKNTK